MPPDPADRRPLFPDPEEQPTMTVTEAGRAFGLSRNTSYKMVNRYIETDGAEGLPVIVFGTQYRVPTAEARRLARLDQADDEPQGPALRVVGDG